VKAEFWHERWEANQLGFHQSEVNPLLARYWPELGLPDDATVFVPLCGKSLDMQWLRAAGHPVIGVEISPIAVRDFFADAGTESVSTPASAGSTLERTSGDGIELHCGDLFALEPEHLARVRAVYDRASLIALPPEMRRRYAQHLTHILPECVEILLITVEYDQTRMKGPPHSVSDREVEELFGTTFGIQQIWSTGVEASSERFRERGLESLRETIWRIHRGTTR
jgi:thiopurine S-methyltransferase